MFQIMPSLRHSTSRRGGNPKGRKSVTSKTKIKTTKSSTNEPSKAPPRSAAKPQVLSSKKTAKSQVLSSKKTVDSSPDDGAKKKLSPKRVTRGIVKVLSPRELRATQRTQAEEDGERNTTSMTTSRSTVKRSAPKEGKCYTFSGI